jgi:hypothetical protein
MPVLIETPVVEASKIVVAPAQTEPQVEQEQTQEKERETRLIRRWVMENGQLVSRWIEI